MPSDYRIGKLNDRLTVSWWEDGKRQRYRLKARTRAEAESEAIAVIQRERARASGSTIDELWELYREEKKGRRIATTMGFEWRAMRPFFGNLRPDQVTVAHCRAYAETRRAMSKADGTIWTELGHLRTVFKWAADRKLIAYAPPVERPQKPRPKERWLTNEEAGRLLDAAKAPHIKLAILLMLTTAGRIGAILDLKWERVDFDTAHVNLRATELGPRKGRAIVPMNDELRAGLSVARGAAISDYVVEWAGERVASIKTGFNAAAIAAGFYETVEGKSGRPRKKPTISPHTLRHTAAVLMVAAGRPMSKVSQYLGHSSIHVTEKVYARYAPDHLREEAAVLSFTKRAKVV